MKELFQFLRDKSLVSAIVIIILMESFLQLGCYRSFLKKNSYAMSVNRITDIAIRSSAELKPNILILGTSIAYEGISPKLLNEKLRDKKIRVQSIAIPGSELIVQDLALRKVLYESNNIKYIIHVNELHLPWIDRRELIDATLSMIGEFNRLDGIRRIYEDGYETKSGDFLFLFFRLVAYRRDFADFILSPDKRIKDFSRSFRESDSNLYSYENSYIPSLSLYNFKNLDECLEYTFITSKIVSGSDYYHRDAIYKTCSLAKQTKISMERNELTDLYKLRLKNLYDFIKSKNVKVINVVPPTSTFLDREEYENLKKFWLKEYGSILSEEKWDFSGIITDEKNSDYYYDLIHFNRKGMELFTEHLGNKLIEKENDLNFE